MKDYEHKETCASCGSTKLSTILDLNNVPLAGYFPSKEELENLKTKNIKSISSHFPSLGMLDRLSLQSTMWGFLALSIGIMIGILMIPTGICSFSLTLFFSKLRENLSNVERV